MKALRSAFLLLLCLVSFDVMLGLGLMEPPIHFAIGWIFSIIRMVGQFEPSWSLAWWIVGLVAFVLLLQRMCGTFSKESPRLKTVATFTGLSWCAILSGMCLAGTVHQVSWLSTSEEPWLKYRSSRGRMVLYHAGALASGLIEDLLERKEWEKRWRATPVPLSASGPPSNAHSVYATHLELNRYGQVEEVVLWPRNGEHFKKFGGMIAKKDAGARQVEQAQLLHYLETMPEVKHER